MIEIDQHEPDKALILMAPVVVCRKAVLNEQGWADYRWRGVSGRYTQVERKTWGEILANVDAVEDQLRRHMKNQRDARLLFVLEGYVDSASDGTYQMDQGKGVWTRGFRSGTNLSRIWSWLYNASEYVEVFQTGNYEQTCGFLIAAYKQDQKRPEEHKTFNRYFKKVTFHPNPQTMQLMGLISGIGEAKAEALIARFTTVWNVVNASPKELQEVPGIGKTLASTLLQRIGRPDV